MSRPVGVALLHEFLKVLIGHGALEVVCKYLFELCDSNDVLVSLVKHLEGRLSLERCPRALVPSIADDIFQVAEVKARPLEELGIMLGQLVVLLLDRDAVEAEVIDDALEALLADQADIVPIEELERVLQVAEHIVWQLVFGSLLALLLNHALAGGEVGPFLFFRSLLHFLN